MTRPTPAALAALALLALVFLTGPALAQDPAAATPQAPAPAAPSARVEDMAWLAGHWRGEGLGGQVEEFWTEPQAGQMIGLFRLVKDGKLVFSEHMALGVDASGALVMKVKHFSPEFVGWEDKEGAVRFVFEEVKPGFARSKALTIQRDGDRLDFALRLRRGEEVREEPLRMSRVRQP